MRVPEVPPADAVPGAAVPAPFEALARAIREGRTTPPTSPSLDSLMRPRPHGISPVAALTWGDLKAKVSVIVPMSATGGYICLPDILRHTLDARQVAEHLPHAAAALDAMRASFTEAKP